MKKIFLAAAIVFVLAAPVFVSAQGLKDAKGVLENIGGVGGEKIGVSADLPTVVATVIKTILALVGTIFLVLTIYAGIMWMTAQGEEEKVTKAKDIIKATVIGLVIIMSAYAITFFVTSKLSGATLGGSNQSGAPDVNALCAQATNDVACINIQATNGNSFCRWDVPGAGAQGVCSPL